MNLKIIAGEDLKCSRLITQQFSSTQRKTEVLNAQTASSSKGSRGSAGVVANPYQGLSSSPGGLLNK